MPLDAEPWMAFQSKQDKKAKLERALAQEVGRRFKHDVIQKLYPEKKVDGVDIGEVCTRWAYIVLTNFSYNEKKTRTLLMMIYMAYDKDKNLDTDTVWKMYMSIFGVTSFAIQLNSFTGIAKLAMGSNLERPKKRSTDYGNVRW